MSNARNLANLLGTATTVQTAKIADDAITNAKLNDSGSFTVAGLTVSGASTFQGVTTATSTTSGFGATDSVLLNATDGSATDAGDALVLNSSASGGTDDGENILFEDATADGAAILNNGHSGNVVQVKTAFTKGENRTSSTTFVTTGLEVSITRKYTNSNILIMASFNSGFPNNNQSSRYTFTRDGVNLDKTSNRGALTNISDSTNDGNRTYATVNKHLSFLDNEVSSTSEITYKLEHLTNSGTSSFNINSNNESGARATCTMTVMEIIE